MIWQIALVVVLAAVLFPPLRRWLASWLGNVGLVVGAGLMVFVLVVMIRANI